MPTCSGCSTDGDLRRPGRQSVWPEGANATREAVERGGAEVSQTPEEAEAFVWLAGPDGLAGVLHDDVRWVQLPSAGVESWMESRLLNDASSVFTSAAGAYAGTVAEHVLALMLAGARRLHECARATEWGERFGHLFAGSTVVILGAGGIGRALIRLLEPFDARVLAITRSGREVPGAAESYSAEETGELWRRGITSWLPPPPPAR